MNIKDMQRLQGQVFALKAYIDAISRTLEVSDPVLFEAVAIAARPVLDDVRKSWSGDDPMVAGFLETFEDLLEGNRKPSLPKAPFVVVKGGKD